MENIRISYGKVAYVNTPMSVLEDIENNINTVMTGDRQVLVDREELVSAMSDEDGYGFCLDKDSEAGQFVLAVIDKFEDGTAEVCFSC